MALGKNHENATKLLVIPFGICLAILWDIKSALLGSVAFITGGIWLSPDLDTQSIALKRWGFLKVLWWPYRKLIRHRSFLSHAPFIGTTLRICYLFVWCFVIASALKIFEFSTPLEILKTICPQLLKNPKEYLPIMIGLEASVWLHLIQDGDPLPSEWHQGKYR